MSISLAQQLIRSNKKLIKMMARNLVVFTDNHFILNDRKYLIIFEFKSGVTVSVEM